MTAADDSAARLSASAEATDEGVDPTLTVQTDGDTLRFGLRGRLGSFRIHEVWGRAAQALEKTKPALLVVDASDVDYCDSSGATMIREFRLAQKARGGRFELRGFPDEYLSVLRLLDRFDADPEPCPPRAGLREHLGRSATAFARDVLELIAAIGEIVAALVDAVIHPSRTRWTEIAWIAQTAGVNALPVTALVTGLLGLIMGFQAAQALRAYGGELVVAELLGKSLLRELGPLMTAVILAARSGSAFAAEIGTMKINEELDALRTMGVDPVRFLVVPRVIAAVVMMPLLTVLANLAGLAGGLVVWTFTLDFSFPAYLSQLELSIHPEDFLTGLAKSVVYGILVAGIGCIRGMQTERNSIAVGQATTSAVVSGIVLIALADSVFTVIFHYLEL